MSSLFICASEAQNDHRAKLQKASMSSDPFDHPPGKLYAIEVKSGGKKSAKGLDAFVEKFPNTRRIVITPENFL